MSLFERWFSCTDASGSHEAVLLITVGAVLLITVGEVLLIAVGELLRIPSSSNAYSLACLSTTVFARICTFKYEALTTLSSTTPSGAVSTLS